MKPYLNNPPDLDQHVDLFDELPLWSAPFGLKLLNAVNYKSGITVLDIGFGNGFPLTELAMRLGDSSTVFGIDPWKSAIERVKRKIDFYGITNIRIIDGVAENIPLQNQSVDLITSNNGLNNVRDIGKVISECARIMKPGGQFIQTMNLDGSMIEFYQVFEEVLRDNKMFTEIQKMHRHITEKRPPLDGMLSKIQECGFNIKNVLHDQFRYRFTDGTSMLNHYFIRLAFMSSWMGILPGDKAVSIFKEIEQKLNEKAKEAGQIILSIPFVLIDSIRIF